MLILRSYYSNKHEKLKEKTNLVARFNTELRRHRLRNIHSLLLMAVWGDDTTETEWGLLVRIPSP